jgi:hypothetical protein
MTERRNSSSVESIDPAVVDRLAARHTPYPEAVAQDVDIISDPGRQDDDGYNWTRLRFARVVAAVLPRSTVVIGSRIGRYPARVIAWDFEVSDDDPIVHLELVPFTRGCGE